MEKELIQDYTRRISQAKASEIIVIIYELFDKYTEDALADYNNEDYSGFNHNLEAAINCVQDLCDALDFSYELANPLMKIYAYVKKEISLMMIRRKTDNLEAVRKQMGELKKSFEELAKNDSSEAVMQNTQTVYAGLTYGKGSLNESIANNSSNRGYTV